LGNQTLYLSLLRKFVDGQADLVERLEQALADGDRPGAERMAHSLKGSAAQIGANAVAEPAARLEAAVRSGSDRFSLQALLAELAPPLDALLAAIAGQVGAPAALLSDPPQVETAQLREVLARLARELDRDEYGSQQTLAQHGPLLRAALGEGAKELAALVGDFDFGGALERLRALAAAHGIEL
jgi:two-component system sensor histidine kinase/response regulator